MKLCLRLIKESKIDEVLTGVETRTSSPIRIKRDDNFQSINTLGLYPAGEGAGYVRGILSAAIDGIKIAEAIFSDRIRLHRFDLCYFIFLKYPFSKLII